MQDFTMYNPTTLHFGSEALGHLERTIRKYGKRVLLVFGKGSIMKSGLYFQILDILNEAEAEWFEYSGIKSNPLIEDVDAAAKLAREKNVDMILAVGGGSVIDSAKAISITIPVEHSGWDFFAGKAKPKNAIPMLALLTLAATGTEMNMFAVVQNEKEKLKLGYGHTLMYPAHSFLNPAFTKSVPPNYTAFGIADLMAHCLENYFGLGKASLTDRFIFSILSEAVEYGPKLMAEPERYEYREAIMYAATMALNGLTSFGKGRGDWGVHSAGHVLSLLYDVPHGASLTIVYPAWLKFHQQLIDNKIEKLGNAVFGVSTADETIEALENFFRSIGCPVTLPEAGIGEDKKNEIYQAMLHSNVQGVHFGFSPEELKQLLEMMF
jgi:alcohol dehydrogenase YqhD (iron-dependent ADH family)